jgi:hypothetical protein
MTYPGHWQMGQDLQPGQEGLLVLEFYSYTLSQSMVAAMQSTPIKEQAVFS